MSQKYWHAKPENRNYWRGPENVRRVQEWRKAHSQYWKRRKPKRRIALQDDMAVLGRSPKMESELLPDIIQGRPKLGRPWQIGHVTNVLNNRYSRRLTLNEQSNKQLEPL